MTNEFEQLARRAVAAPGWRWMPRMLALPGAGGLHPELGRVVVDDVADGVPQRWHHERALHFSVWRCWAVDFPAALPDLADPATLGCLLALVREAWGAPLGQVSPALDDGAFWVWYHNKNAPETRPRGDTEAEALVAALEAAPVEGR